MDVLKTARNLTIASITLFIVTVIVNAIDYPIDKHRFQDPSILWGISWILSGVCIFTGVISWIFNVIAVYKNIKSRWLYWLNTILTVMAGYYLLLFIATVVDFVIQRYWCVGLYDADLHRFMDKSFILYSFREAHIIITTCFVFAWFVQYIINSIYVLKAYSLYKRHQ